MEPLRRPPQQARSRASEQKLVDAARSLLAERSWDEVAVADIAARARLTVGAFYARFPSKEALFRHLETLAFDQSRRKVARITALADGGASPLELLHELVRSNVRIYRDNAALVRALVVRSHVDAELRERLRELSRENFAIVGRALVRAGAIDHDDVRWALEFALYAERSVLREAVLFGEGWSKEREWSDEHIVTETVRLIARYLGLDEARSPARKQPNEP